MNAIRESDKKSSVRSWLETHARPMRPATLLAAFLCLLAAGRSPAATLATATLTDVSLGGGLFDYTIDLQNTGTTPIETFWYAWVPGKDYLATRPTPVNPSGWSNIITGGSPGDGFAIQWTTSTASIAAGSSLNFSFESTDPPAAIAGDSVFFPGTPVGTSFVYQGGPFAGGSDQFVVASVPEPSTTVALATGLVCLFGWVCVKRRTKSSDRVFVIS